MPIPDRFNPRIWLRNIIVRVNRWLWKLTPAERAELARMWAEADEVINRAFAPSSPGEVLEKQAVAQSDTAPAPSRQPQQ